MKRVTTLSLLCASSLAALPSFATEGIKFNVGGHVSMVGAVVDQSNMDGLDQGVLAIDSGFYGSAALPLDGIGEIGAKLGLDLDYASNFNDVLNDAGSSDILEEAWIYWDSRYGRFQMGLQDGAADILGLGVPSVTANIRVDNPEIFLMGYPCSTFCTSDPQLPGSLFSPNGMQLRSDISGSDSYLKFMYVTPDMSGLRLAVSYAPDGTRNLGDVFGDDGRNEQGNIWDFAANYLRTVGEVDFGLSVGVVQGENLRNTSPGFNGDLDEWGAAARVGYREWTAGIAYRQTNVTGGGPVQQGLFTNVIDDLYTDIWSFGVTYESGPWMAGVNYVTSDAELIFAREQQGSGLQFAGAYTVNEYVRVSGGYQHFEFEGPIGTCITGLGGFGCDTLDGDVGYVETTFSF